MVGSFFRRVTQTADEVLLSGQKDVEEFFEHEKNYLLEYHSHIKDATIKADKVCRSRKNIADSFAKIASNLEKIGQVETNGGDKDFGLFLHKAADTFERLKKAESRVGTDEELKEADTLRYFMRESQAGKDLLYRRLRCLANYEGANKNLERARARNRDIQKAESDQADACKKFEDIGVVAKSELIDLKKRRVEAFKKNLAELVDLEVKQSKNKLSILQYAMESIRESASHPKNNSMSVNLFSAATSSPTNGGDFATAKQSTEIVHEGSTIKNGGEVENVEIESAPPIAPSDDPLTTTADGVADNGDL